MSVIRVKICGLTRVEDVDAAVRLGAYAVGFVFAGGPRHLPPEAAARLTLEVPEGTLRVGLFLNQPRAEIEAVLERVELDLLQFHGTEHNEFCRGFALPFLKAVSMRETRPEAVALRYPDAAGILLDSHAPGGRGGTGRTGTWRRRPDLAQPLWLAGGLTPGNVGRAIQVMRPWAVDVSSGVETTPGHKDPELIRRFMEAVRQENDDDPNA